MTSNIIEKIQKLFALASDKGATEAEAAQALSMAHRLMTKHGLDQARVEVKPEIGSGYVDHRMQRWHQFIAMGACRLYGAIPIFERSSCGFSIVGRDEHRAAAAFTFAFIVDQIEALYKDGLPKGLSKKARSNWRKEFKTGAAIRVSNRIGRIIADLTKDDETAIAAVGCTALVVLDHRSQLEDEVDSFINSTVKGLKTRDMALKVKPTEAATLGLAAGNKVKINQELGEHQ